MTATDPTLNPFLQCVVQAESGGDYQAVSPNGLYMGVFQSARQHGTMRRRRQASAASLASRQIRRPRPSKTPWPSPCMRLTESDPGWVTAVVPSLNPCVNRRTEACDEPGRRVAIMVKHDGPQRNTLARDVMEW